MFISDPTVNVNPVTGIRYGVASGNNYPDLVDHIMQNGRDLAYEYFVSEIKSSFESYVDQTSHDNDRVFIQSEIESVLDDISLWPKLDQDDLDNMVTEVLEPSGDESLGERLYSLIEGNIQYESDSDSASYELEENECKYGLSSLGGAILIWVYESPSVVYVNSLCSPCVPNGGDIDSGLTDQDNGYQCYGTPDQWL